jgi:NADH dehydrogenase
MPRRIFVTGGSGFVGSAVIEELLNRGHAVRALVNRRPLRNADRATEVRGDLFDPAALDRGVAGCDAIVHLVGIIMEKRSAGITFERIHFEGTKAVVDAAERNNVKRYLQMSALGTRADAESRYHQTKYQAERYVQDRGLDYTILRPSMIHGPGGDLMKMEARWARGQAPPWFFMPYFGAGTSGRRGAGKLQPVHVKDVARAFADALDKPRTVGETYPVAGSETITWPDLHRAVARAVVGRERPVMAIPAWYAKALTYVTPPSLLPFNRDQVIMSQEDNTADMSKFREDFGWAPAGFGERFTAYADQL